MLDGTASFSRPSRSSIPAASAVPYAIWRTRIDVDRSPLFFDDPASASFFFASRGVLPRALVGEFVALVMRHDRRDPVVGERLLLDRLPVRHLGQVRSERRLIVHRHDDVALVVCLRRAPCERLRRCRHVDAVASRQKRVVVAHGEVAERRLVGLRRLLESGGPVRFVADEDGGVRPGVPYSLGQGGAGLVGAHDHGPPDWIPAALRDPVGDVLGLAPHRPRDLGPVDSA